MSTNLFADDSVYVYGKRVLPSISKPFELREGEPFYLENFERYLPNVTSLKGGQRSRFIQIRGVGERSDYTPLVYRSVGIFVDGIDYSDFPQAVHRFGLESSQLILGPNPNGRLGGVINHLEKNHSFKDQWMGHIGASDEKAGTMALQYISSSASEVKVKANIVRHKGEGFYFNKTINGKKNDRDEFLSKLSLRWRSLTQKIHFHNLDNGYDAFNLDNSYVTTSDRPGKDQQEIFVSETSYSYSLNQLFLKSSFEYFKANSLYSYDEDWSNTSSYDYDIFFRKKRERITLTQEFEAGRLNSMIRYIDLKEDQQERKFNGGVTRGDTLGEVRRRLLWSQFSYDYDLNEKTQLLLEGSIELNKLSYRNDQGFNRTREEIPYFLSLGYKKYYYALTLKHATKGGGFSTQSQIPDDRKSYDKESMSTLELSFDGDLLSKKLKVKTNTFVQYRDNLQISTSYQDDPSDPSSFTFYIDNATSSWGYGLEQQIVYLAHSRLKLKTSLSMIEASFNNYQIGAINQKGRELPYTPNYQALVGAELYFLENLFLSVDYYQQDNYYFSNSHNQMGHGYRQWDFRLNYKREKTNLSLYVNNAFNEDIQTRGFFIGNRPPDFKKELFTQRGVPRVVGISLDLAY